MTTDAPKRALPVLFSCKPLHARLTRRACGMRHDEASATDLRSTHGPRVTEQTCATCEVGAAHKRGEEPMQWPDGTPIELPLLAHTPSVKEMPMARPPQVFTFKEKTQTLEAWAVEIGISRSGLAARLKRMPFEKAITLDVDESAKKAGEARVGKLRVAEAKLPKSRPAKPLPPPIFADPDVVGYGASPGSVVAPPKAPKSRPPKALRTPKLGPDRLEVLGAIRALLSGAGYDVEMLGSHPRGIILIVNVGPTIVPPKVKP